MYLNLDLLYNVNIYLYPLFYYKDASFEQVYCPITENSVYFYNNVFLTFDSSNNPVYKKDHTITKDTIYYENIVNFNKCKPFKIDKEYLKYLKNLKLK